MKESFTYNDKHQVKFSKENPLFSYKGFSNDISLKSFYASKTDYDNYIYSISMVNYTDVKDLFNDLKHIDADDEIYVYYEFVKAHINFLIHVYKIDIICLVPSSSKFLNTLYNILINDNELRDATPIKITKNSIFDVKINYSNQRLKIKDWDEFEKNINTAIAYQIKKGNTEFKVKDFPKKFLPAITNIFSINIPENYLKDANVLVLDDNYSSGFTLKTIVDELSNVYGCNTTGLTLFKFRN
jgi:hypothetical protein